MQNVSIASRYARALLEATGSSLAAASSSNAAYINDVAVQLKQLVDFLSKDTRLNAALCNPVLPKAQRHALTEALIAASDGVAAPVANLLRMLTERARFSLLSLVCSRFEALADTHAGCVRGTVTSARPLSAQQFESVRGALEKMTHKRVLLEQKVDSTILGGVVAQVGSTVYDGSLRNELRRLTERLSGASIDR
jgi:F-type H+-transporting ATPase subunit delta